MTRTSLERQIIEKALAAHQRQDINYFAYVAKTDLWDLVEKLSVMRVAHHDSPALSANATDTQRTAAANHMPRRATLRRRILDEVRSAGQTGLTCDELEVRLLRPHTSVSSAVNSLVRQGWLTDSGDRRDTRNHTPAIVWHLTVAGDREYRQLTESITA